MTTPYWQDEVDFPALLEELALGDCVFRYRVLMNRWDALLCEGGHEGVALMAKVWVPSQEDWLAVRLPLTPANDEALCSLSAGDRVAFVAPFERAYLDYPVDSPFEVTEQHVLYALGVEKMEG